MRRGFRGLSLRQTTPVPPLQFVAQSIPLLRAGESYPAFKVEATGGRGPKLYEVVDPSDLPPGMTMGEDGIFPSAILREDAAGIWQAEIRVSAQGAAPISAIMTFDVAAKRLTIRVTPQPCPSAVIGSDYSGRVYLTVDGGDAVDDVSIFPGTGLPTGLSLTLVDQPTSLVIYEVTGTPTGGGGLTFIAVVVATSTDGQSVTVDLTIPVQAQQNPLTLTYPAASNAEVGAAYSALTPSTTGGTGTLTYSRTGAMPGGMAFNTSTGTFSTANVTGTAGSSYRSVVTVTDQSTPAKTATAVVVIVVNAASAPTITMTLPTFTDGVPGATYTKTATTANQTGTVSWALGVDDVLPPGITFSNGVWSGTFGYSGANQTYSGSVTATDSGSAGAITKSWSIRVGAVPASLQLTYPAFPTVATGDLLSAVTPTRVGGVGPFVYSLAQGAFGLQINASTGAVSASALTAPEGSTVNDTVILVDQGATTGASSVQAQITIQMAVAAGPTITLTMPTFATAVPGQAYSAACTAGGTFAGDGVWSVNSATGLPAGMTLVESGTNNDTLTFTATSVDASSANKIFSGTVKVTDSLDADNFATKSFLINVAALPATFVAPTESSTPSDIEFDADTDGSATITVSSHMAFGSVSAANVTMSLEAVTTLPPGVSIGANTTGTGTIGVSFSEALAPDTSTVEADVRLVWTYDDPGASGGGVDLSLASREADWTYRQGLSDVVLTQDFSLSRYPTYSAIVAACAGGGSGSTPSSGQYDLQGYTGDFVTGGQCFQLEVYDGAGAQGGCFTMYYPFSPYDYQGFYVQVVMQMDDAALGWVPIQSDGSTSETAQANKIFYLKNNSSGGGQTYFVGGAGMGGFLRWNQSNNDALKSAMPGATGSGSATMYHHQNAIDNGQPTGNNFLERIQRYGVEQRNIGYGVAEGNAGSATAAVPLFHQRTGYPMAAAVQAGSFLATPNRWFVAETYIDPAPPDVFPSTGGTPIPNARVNAAAVAAQAGRIARVVGWAAHYGDPPKVLADTFHPLNYAGPYVPARTDSGTDLRYNELRCQNYNTKRIAEPGRPTMRYRYAQVIVSRRPIPFPHHPGVALPDSPYGAITHYGSIL